MAPHILPRQGSSPSTNGNLAGGLIGGFVALIVLLALLCHFCLRRSRANNAPTQQQGGVTRPMMMELDPAQKNLPPPPPFSRERLRASIIMPVKTIIPKRPSSQSLSGKAVPSQPIHPPSPLSIQSSLAGPSSAPSLRPPPSPLNPSQTRRSRASSAFSAYAHFNFPSRPNSRAISLSSTSSDGPKAVRQAFEPTLPDELFLRRGEYLSVLQSFDDGWCLVARDRSRSSRISRLSMWMKKENKLEGDDVDIGLVPAWVFIKPLHGVNVTRPFRSSSVNALNGGAFADARNAVISWSMF